MSTLLNPRHEAFAQALANGETAIAAHEKAGFKPHRGNAARLAQDESIRVRVTEILSRKAVIEEKATQKAIDKLAITKEKVLADLQVMASFEMSQVVDWGDSLAVPDADGTMHLVQGFRMKNRSEIPESVLGAITEIKLKNGQLVAVKGPDRLAALMSMAKILGLVVDKQEVGTPGQFTQMTDEELLAENERLDAALSEHEAPDRLQ